MTGATWEQERTVEGSEGTQPFCRSVRQNSAGSVTSLSLTSTDADLVNLRPGFVDTLHRILRGKGFQTLSISQADMLHLLPRSRVLKELDASFAFLASYQDASYQDTGKIVKISLSSFSVDTRLQRSSSCGVSRCSVTSQCFACFGRGLSPRLEGRVVRLRRIFCHLLREFRRPGAQPRLKPAPLKNHAGYSGFALCSMTPKVIRYALGTMAFLEEKDFTEHRTDFRRLFACPYLPTLRVSPGSRTAPTTGPMDTWPRCPGSVSGRRNMSEELP